jgi:predicted metal-binding membrane protein
LWFFGAMFVLGWTLMTIAMMLPTAVPLLVMFLRLVENKPNPGVLVALVVSGYLGVWLVFGVAVQIANRILQMGMSELEWMSQVPWLSGAILLAGAGLYQFSALKYACLDKCRTPLSFVTSRWRGGNERAQALRIGIDHGVFCVGCCWSLMLLMFLVGAGNLGWMLVLGAVMALEKNFPWGKRMSAPLGVVLLGWAGVVVYQGWFR